MLHSAITHEQARVWGGSAIALAVSYTNLEQSLRITLLIVSIVYGVLKLWKSARSKTPLNDTDPPIK